MDINSISFGKRIRNEKTENQKQSLPISNSETKSDKSILQKGNNALTAYTMALLAMGGSAAGLTSCVETESHSESYVNIDLEEFKKMFQQLLDMQNLILAQLQQNTTDNKEMIKILKEQNKVLQDIFNGVIDIKDGITKLYALALEGNEFDKEYVKKLDQIIDGQAKDNDKLKQILEESQKQTAWMANIGPFIESIANISAVTGDKLNQFYEAYLNKELTHSEFREKLLAAVVNNGNISKEILEEVKGLRADCDAGKITEAELLQKIADLLSQINDKMDVVIGKLNDINGNIIALKEQNDANHKETVEKLGDIGAKIENGFTINQSQMQELIQLSKDGNKNTTDMLVEMQNMKDILIQIKEKDGNLKLEELLTKYGDIMDSNFQQVMEILKEDKNVNINNIDDIINAINNSKPDLSKIQEQMGTVIVLLQKAQSAGLTPDDLLPLVEGLKNLQESNEAGTAQTNTNLSQLITDVAGIKGMMSVVVETMGDMLRNQVKYGNAAEVSFAEVTDGMKKLLAGQLTQEQMDALMTKHRVDLTQAEASLAQGVQLLQALLDAQGQGNSGMTPEELGDVINNSSVLNQIKDALDALNVDRVTNTTLNEAMIANKTDLSKIQEQMGTVIVLLQKTQSGSVTVDTSKLETAINELSDVVTNQGVTSNSAMGDISAKLDNLIALLTKETEPPATKMVSQTTAEAKMPHNMPYRVSLSQIQKAYEEAMMA